MNSLSNNRKIYFRVDYGGLIGRGHLSRCLALAESFKSKGFTPVMVVRKRASNLNDQLPFQTIWLSEAPDVVSVDPHSWLCTNWENEAQEMIESIEENSLVVLDHYALGIQFQKKLRSKNHKLILFQDIPSIDFSADILINYNIGAMADYKNLFPYPNMKLLLGPEYAPLNLVYVKEHHLRLSKDTKIETIGIYLGGIEKKYLERAARAINSINYFLDKKVEWVVNSVEEKKLLSAIFENKNVEIHVTCPSLLTVYTKVQLFIGACGISFLERACCGLWQFNFLVADNQKIIAKHIEENQLGVMLGDIRTLTLEQIILNIEEAIVSSRELNLVRVKNAFSLLDGNGALLIAEKCLEELK